MSWGHHQFTEENAEEIKKFCLPLYEENISSKWSELNIGPQHVYDTSIKKTIEETDKTPLDINHEEKDNAVRLIADIFESCGVIEESALKDLPSSSIEQALSAVLGKLDDQKFLNFCKMISAWSDNSLINACFKLVILKKLQEKSESSLCTVTSIQDLTEKMPDKVCDRLLIPLTTDITPFTDYELISSIFPMLPALEKDKFMSAITSKNDLTEGDWLLLQPLVPHISEKSFLKICERMINLSNEYSSNQRFSKFLVIMCKNVPTGTSKDLLYEVAKQNTTFFKRQALKFLES